MKTNVPEKIYILPHKDYSDRRIMNAFTEKEDSEDIEYIRQDAFIDKAVSWLKNFNDFHNIMRYSDCSEVPLDQLICDFKNYITEEKV